MYCRYCGKEINEGDPFCRHCGCRALSDGENPNACYSQSPDLPRYTFDRGEKELPKELRNKFNVGAFATHWIWAIFNGLWYIGIPLLLLRFFIQGFDSGGVTVLLLTLIIYAVQIGIAFFGNHLAWKSKKWPSIYHFELHQLKWAKWGSLCMGIISLIIGTISGFGGIIGGGGLYALTNIILGAVLLVLFFVFAPRVNTYEKAMRESHLY